MSDSNVSLPWYKKILGGNLNETILNSRPWLGMVSVFFCDSPFFNCSIEQS